MLDFGSIDQTEASVDLLFSDEHIFSLRNRDIRSYSERLHQERTSGKGGSEGVALPLSEGYYLYDGNNSDVRLARWIDTDELIKFIPDSANIYPQKMPVIKLAEMYLLIAECTYDTDPAGALEYINTFRKHRIRANTPWQYLTLDNIYEEMRREYIGEGQMWYVYKRNNLAVPNTESTPSNHAFVFPLPDSEIENGHRNER